MPRLLTDILTGGMASSLATLFTNPMEMVKTRLQLQGELAAKGGVKHYRGISHAFVKIASEEGIMALQKGLVPGVIYQFFMNGARLGSYPTLKRMLRDDGTSSVGNTLRQFSAAAISGALGATVGSPFFMIKCRLQAQSNVTSTIGHYNYKGVSDGLMKVLAQEGIPGLFRGIDGAVPRVMVGSATQLATYDSTKRLLLGWGVVAPGVQLHVAASMCSGLVVTTLMNPFDVVSTRLYNQPQQAARVYNGLVDCFIKTYRAEGIGGFYKGWLAHYTRLGPHTVLSLVFWEQARSLAGWLGMH